MNRSAAREPDAVESFGAVNWSAAHNSPAARELDEQDSFGRLHSSVERSAELLSDGEPLEFTERGEVADAQPESPVVEAEEPSERSLSAEHDDEDREWRAEQAARRAQLLASGQLSPSFGSYMPTTRHDDVAEETRDESSGEEVDERVQSLRSHLASLFDIAPAVSRSSREDSGEECQETVENAGDDFTESVDTTTSDDADAGESESKIDLTGLLSSLQAPAAPAPQPAPPPAPYTPPSRAVELTDIEDSASVAAYMEQLFARNRRGIAPEAEPVLSRPAAAPVKAVETPVMRSTPATGQESASVEVDSEEPVEKLTEIPAPMHKPNRDAIRANIHSLREVANQTARSALARHSSQRLRTQSHLKAILATTSFLLAGLLLSPELTGAPGFVKFGWALAAIGLVVMCELALSIGVAGWWKQKISSRTKTRKTAPQGVPEAVAAQASQPASAIACETGADTVHAPHERIEADVSAPSAEPFLDGPRRE